MYRRQLFYTVMMVTAGLLAACQDGSDFTGLFAIETVTAAFGWTVAAGDRHACAASASGVTKCWGSDANGQLGTGLPLQDRSVPTLVLQPDVGGTRPAPAFQIITAGDAHSCGLNSALRAYCWGLNQFGQLGDATFTDRPTAVPVAGALSFSIISAGGTHTCGISFGATYCWGGNANGQLGRGIMSTSSPNAGQVHGNFSFTKVSAGGSHTCAITSSGAAYCWGNGGNGRLGNGSTASRSLPTLVSGGHLFKDISAGPIHTCGVTTANNLFCWGDNGLGALGDGTLTDRLMPVRTLNSTGHQFTSVSTGLHTCAWDATAAYCWGPGEHGELGLGSTASTTAPTDPVLGGIAWKKIENGSIFTCGQSTSDRIYCWGDTANGESGVGISGPGRILTSPSSAIQPW